MNKLFLEDSTAIVNFFEGEGCISIKDNRSVQSDVYSISISIANTNIKKLTQCQKILGIGNIRLIAKDSFKHKARYELAILKRDQQSFLDLLINSKYLIIKKYQTLTALEWYKEITNCTVKKGTIYREKCISLKEATIREILFDTMKLLNKTGPYFELELIELQKVKNYYDWWFEENYPEQCKMNKEFNK